MIIYKGKIFSGFGKGSKYLERYRDLYEKYIKIHYYAGTLNLESDKDLEIPDNAIYLPQNASSDLNQGVYFIPAKLFNEKVFIIYPEKTDHPKNVIEIISESKLRDKYKLSDGDIIEISIDEC